MANDISRRSLLRYSVLGLGGAALLGLAGCSTAGAGAPVTTPGAADPTPTNFAFASWSLSEEAAKPTIEAALKSFSSAEGISIDTSAYPYDEYLNQLTLQVQGRAVLRCGTARRRVAVGPRGTRKADQPVRIHRRPRLHGRGTGCRRIGRQAAQTAWTIGAIGLIGNAELFDKAGASLAPGTIDEFEDGLRALKGIGVIPYAASTKAAQLKDIVVWMQTLGSPIIEDGKSTIGDDASVEAVSGTEGCDDGLIAADVDRAAARTLFSQGATALYDDAPVGKSSVVSQSPDATLGDKMTPIARPVLKAGSTPQHVLWGHLVVVVDGEGAGTAADFAQWLTSDPQQSEDYFAALGLPQTTEAALASDTVTANAFVQAFTETVTSTAEAEPAVEIPSYAQMETAIAEQVQAVLIGQKSASDAMKTAGGTITGLI